MIMLKVKKVFYLFFASILTINSAENRSDIYGLSDNESKYLNNFVNISNSPPELIDYYDLDVSLDDVLVPSPPPEIYPDPQGMINNENKMKATSDKPSLSNLPIGIDGIDGIDDDAKNEDLRGHNTIDNIMYIYYGSSGSRRKSLGGNIVIVGAVFALAAQILAIVLSILRNRRFRRSNHLSCITLNLLFTLCASNFVFIVGVQSSKSLVKCEIIAIMLHYLHLSTSLLGLCHSYSIYDYVINENMPNLKHNNLIAYCGSAVYVMFSFAVASTNYETFDFCWMSVQRGMIINFMIPISALIVATTILGTFTLKSVVARQREVMVENIDNILEKCQQIDSRMLPVIEKGCDGFEKVCDTELKRVDFYDSKFDLGALSITDLSLQSSTESQDFTEFKNAVKFSLFFQPAFAVCWFLGVVALENRHSCIMPVTFIICYNILNWYILYRLDSICPVIGPAHNSNSLTTSTLNCNQFDTKSNNDDGSEQPSCGADTIPLLCTVATASQGIGEKVDFEDTFKAESWETNMENINLDCISTISN